MLEKAKELQRLRLENKKQPSRNSSDGFSGGFGSSSMSSQSATSSSSQRFQSSMDSNKPEVVQPPSFSSNSGGKSNAMRLGGSKPLPAFLEQTAKQAPTSSSGGTSTTTNTNNNQSSSTTSTVNMEKYFLFSSFNSFSLLFPLKEFI